MSSSHDSRAEMINSKKHIYQQQLQIKKVTIERMLQTLDQQKTNVMPLHDLKSMFEIEILKYLGNTQKLPKSSRAILEFDAFSISTEPVEFYFGFFNLLHGLYASPSSAQSTTTASPTSNQQQPPKSLASNLLKLPKSPIHYLDIECIRELVQFMLQMDVAQFSNGLTFLCKSLVEDVVVAASAMTSRQGGAGGGASPQLKAANGGGKESSLATPATPSSSKDENTLKTRLASCMANQLLIQVIAMAFPDMFFGRNEKDAPDSPAKQVFAHYQKHLAAGKGVGNALLWICCQQSFSLANGRRVVHPKCLELWFAYFYPLLSTNTSNTWDKKSAMSFIDVVLDNLIKQPNAVQYDSMDLAVIPMPTFSSLFNAVFLQPQSHSATQVQSLEKIYRKLKHLMFISDRAKIITSTPLQILTTLLAPLPHLAPATPSHQECVDLLANLLASHQYIPGGSGHSSTSAPLLLGAEMVNAWVGCFGDYSKETGVLVDYLIEKSKPQSLWSGDSGFWLKIRSSGLSAGMEKMAARNKHLVRSFKKSQPHLVKLQSRLKLLAKLSKPPPSLSSLLMKSFIKCFWLLLTMFLFYALVYVQCDPSSSHHRVCPLPIDPHLAIHSLKKVPVAVADFVRDGWNHGDGKVGWVAEDVIGRWTAYLSTLWKPTIQETTVYLHKAWLMIPPSVVEGVVRVYDQVGRWWVSSGLERIWVMWLVGMEANASITWTKWNEFTSTQLPYVMRVLGGVWHDVAVDFVDVYLPLVVLHLNTYSAKAETWARESSLYLLEKWRQVMVSPVVLQIKSHWALVWLGEEYALHIDPLLVLLYKTMLAFYQTHIARVVENVVDLGLDWKGWQDNAAQLYSQAAASFSRLLKAL